MQKLESEFAMKDLGPLSYFLGIEVKYFPGGIHLTQSKYASDMLKRVNMAENPNSVHLQAVKRMVRYVKGTIDHGLRIISHSSFRLYGFSDVDWAGCTITRRSTTGYSVYLGANCVSWSSRKQNTVARSSAEAEYRALAATAAEITWIYILQDIEEKVARGQLVTQFVRSKDQLANMHTKALGKDLFKFFRESYVS
ncbi:uncharacterized mitochondrial protein AtMg00810-like [Lycium barbarum]|uniref:uncharacterized mitochondrial protein AtMg00810-like n=1 Tax=Lycium barbarum TaxID=112863 RepID=UPI00293E33C8|nr:uncharacterized mitochondrial protein AtMg00810-like [Lycium barbarum]